MIFAASALVVVESALIAWCSAHQHPYRVRGFVVITNMLIIMLFSGVTMSVGGYVTNVGTICYAAATAGQCVIIGRFGYAAARDSIWHVSCGMAAMLALITCLSWFPPVSGHEAAHAAVALAADKGARVVAASFSAFLLSQICLILVWQRLAALPTWALILASSAACQIVDTPVFFFVAFGNAWSAAAILEAAAVGLAVKLALSVAFLPTVVMSIRSRRISD